MFFVRSSPSPTTPPSRNYSSSWTGPTSPYSVQELNSMGTARVVEMLAIWEPGEDRTRSPLGRRPRSHPSGDREVGRRELCGSGVGVRESRARLCRRAARRPRRSGEGGKRLRLGAGPRPLPMDSRPAPGRLAWWDRSAVGPSWVWSRQQVASLLSEGLKEGSAEIPIRPPRSLVGASRRSGRRPRSGPRA